MRKKSDVVLLGDWHGWCCDAMVDGTEVGEEEKDATPQS
jgi:hypothetical protein